MKVSDYVVKAIEDEGVKHVFMVAGGPIMHLMDSLDRSKKLEYVCTHHEQAAAMAADGYQRMTGNLGVALATTGPGGTNMITGVVGAWMDSLPTIFITGQVNTKSLIGETGLRQRGVHEADIVSMVKPVTKYAVTITDPKRIRYCVEKAIWLARNGRPGPVWLDIPINVQATEVDIDSQQGFDAAKECPPGTWAKEKLEETLDITLKLLDEAKRPLIVLGHGVRLSHGIGSLNALASLLRIPIVCSKNAYDILPYDHPCFIGMAGINGSRSANFAVQASDLMLVLGSRLATPFTGYEHNLFAPNAKRIVVDIDAAQLKSPNVHIDYPLNEDVKTFMDALIKRREESPHYSRALWLERCQQWKQKYAYSGPKLPNEISGEHLKNVDAYFFFDQLSEHLPEDSVVVVDQGSTFYASTQALRLKEGQRFFTNGGFSPMGYGLPAAIGAAFATGKDVVCVHGDGGLQLNIQELQTIAHYNIPIKLFVFNNNGYVSIKHTMMNYFGKMVACDPGSGLSCPDTLKVAKAYGLPCERIENNQQLMNRLERILQTKGPMVVDVTIDPMQPNSPKVMSEKLPDGRMVSKPLDDMAPYLSREEYAKETEWAR